MASSPLRIAPLMLPSVDANSTRLFAEMAAFLQSFNVTRAAMAACIGSNASLNRPNERRIMAA